MTLFGKARTTHYQISSRRKNGNRPYRRKKNMSVQGRCTTPNAADVDNGSPDGVSERSSVKKNSTWYEMNGFSADLSENSFLLKILCHPKSSIWVTRRCRPALWLSGMLQNTPMKVLQQLQLFSISPLLLQLTHKMGTIFFFAPIEKFIHSPSESPNFIPGPHFCHFCLYSVFLAQTTNTVDSLLQQPT